MVLFYQSFSMENIKKFNDFYQKFFSLIYSTAYRFCPEDVDDIVADFIEKKILKGDKIDKFLEHENPEALITLSVKHLCITQIRLKKKNKSISLDEILPLNLSVENEINTFELSDKLKHVLLTLSEGRRSVIELTIQGYDDSEIADLLKTSVNSVRQMRYRARTKIWDSLNE